MNKETIAIITLLFTAVSTTIAFLNRRSKLQKEKKKYKEKLLKLERKIDDKTKKLEAAQNITKEEINQKAEVEIKDRLKVFPAKRDYNEEFYEYFKEKIREAKTSVYITGDGFAFQEGRGSEIAAGFNAEMRAAFDRGVRIYRVQIKPNGAKKWINNVSALLKNNDSKDPHFKFFYLTKGKKSQISSVCVIDHENPNENVSEFMLETTKVANTNKEGGRIAGTGVFIENNNELATSLVEGIESMIEGDDCVELKTGNEVEKHLKHLYFAYGSNMDNDQMLKRCASANKVDIGILENYDVVFNRKGSHLDGGVASVEQKKGKNVYGIMWRIDSEDLLELDEIEDTSAYDREILEIADNNGNKYECNVYIARPQGDIKPNEEYLEKVIKAAKTANLPKQYIKRLELFRDSK